MKKERKKKALEKIINLILDFGVQGGLLIIGGVVTVVVTKSIQRYNIPMDKLEIAYNRIYYPLYKFLRENESNDKEERLFLQEKVDKILLKYDKYFSQDTRFVYKEYKELEKLKKKERKKKRAYIKFKNNIFEKNVKLRNSIGYPQSSFWEMFKYLPYYAQHLFYAIIAYFFMITLTFIYKYFPNDLIPVVVFVLLIYIIVTMIIALFKIRKKT